MNPLSLSTWRSFPGQASVRVSDEGRPPPNYSRGHAPEGNPSPQGQTPSGSELCGRAPGCRCLGTTPMKHRPGSGWVPRPELRCGASVWAPGSTCRGRRVPKGERAGGRRGGKGARPHPSRMRASLCSALSEKNPGGSFTSRWSGADGNPSMRTARRTLFGSFSPLWSFSGKEGILRGWGRRTDKRSGRSAEVAALEPGGRSQASQPWVPGQPPEGQQRSRRAWKAEENACEQRGRGEACKTDERSSVVRWK